MKNYFSICRVRPKLTPHLIIITDTDWPLPVSKLVYKLVPAYLKAQTVHVYVSGLHQGFPLFPLFAPLSLPICQKTSKQEKKIENPMIQKACPSPHNRRNRYLQIFMFFLCDFYTEESGARDFESLYKRWKEWGGNREYSLPYPRISFWVSPHSPGMIWEGWWAARKLYWPGLTASCSIGWELEHQSFEEGCNGGKSRENVGWLGVVRTFAGALASMLC